MQGGAVAPGNKWIAGKKNVLCSSVGETERYVYLSKKCHKSASAGARALAMGNIMPSNGADLMNMELKKPSRRCPFF